MKPAQFGSGSSHQGVAAKPEVEWGGAEDCEAMSDFQGGKEIKKLGKLLEQGALPSLWGVVHNCTWYKPLELNSSKSSDH